MKQKKIKTNKKKLGIIYENDVYLDFDMYIQNKTQKQKQKQNCLFLLYKKFFNIFKYH